MHSTLSLACLGNARKGVTAIKIFRHLYTGDIRQCFVAPVLLRKHELSVGERLGVSTSCQCAFADVERA